MANPWDEDYIEPESQIQVEDPPATNPWEQTYAVEQSATEQKQELQSKPEPEKATNPWEQDYESDIEPTEQQPTQEEPTTGEVLTGLGTEIGVGLGGQAAGAAIGTAIAPGVGTAIGYGVGAIGSGIAGSIAAQKIEGREDISWGRAIGAGLANLIPGGAGKAAKGAKIGAGVIARSAARGIATGAATGATEEISRQIIDEGRLPTKEELGTMAGAGALFGGALGAAAPKVSKTLGKYLGKSTDELDDAIVRGEVEYKDLKPILKEAPLGASDQATEGVFRREVAEMTKRKQSEQAAEVLTSKPPVIELGAPKQKIKNAMASIMPSRAIGNKANDDIINFQRKINEFEELGSKISDKLGREIAEDPGLNDKLNRYLNSGKLDDALLRGKAGGEVLAFDEARRELQQEIIQLLDEGGFRSLDDEARKSLTETIKKSMTDNAYVRRDYQMFLNKDFQPNPKLEKAAMAEMAEKFGSEEKALEHINRLKNASAKNQAIDPRAPGVPGVNSIFKAEHKVGPAEREWLGEITEAPERMRGTLTGLARAVARESSDMNVARTLQETGLAFPAQGEGMVELVLRGTPREGSGLFVNPEVQVALNQLYLPKNVQNADSVIIKGLKDLYSAGVGVSKATKVLMNPPAYAVQLYGNAINLAGMGINPLSKQAGKGFNLALSEFGSVDRLRKSPAARKALLDDMREMNRYGIKSANVLQSDIRSTLDEGMFSNLAGKVFEPLGKAYSVPDTMGRYVGWKSNQRTLKKLYPDAPDDMIKRAAANIINDTYQNYDKLSNTVRTLSKWGVMPQFASFTAELMRNQYNQGRIIKKMLQGDLGEYAQGLGQANTRAMKIEGAKRLASLSAVYAATAGAIQGVKAAAGVDPEKEAALRDVAYAPWDKNRDLMVSLNKDGNTGWTANMSYISPHAMLESAFKAGFDGEEETSVIGALADELVGEGSFVMQNAFRALQNRDARGEKVTTELDKLKNVQDRVKFFLAETFKPGVAREYEKFDKALQGKGALSVNDILVRQGGVRYNPFNVDKNATRTIRDNYESSTQSKADYYGEVKYNETMTPEQRQAKYNDAVRQGRDSFNALRKNYESLKTLGRTDDEIISIMRDARVSSKDMLAVIENNYQPIPYAKTPSSSEVYELLEGSMAQKRDEIIKITRQDPVLGKSLQNRWKREVRGDRSGISEKESLIKNLSNMEKVNYIKSQPNPNAAATDLFRKKVISKDVYNAYRQAL